MTKNIQGNFSPLIFDNRLGLKTASGSYEGEPAETLGYSTVGDGGDVEFTWTQGSPPATFVDDGNATTLPDGGDGSAAWIATETPQQYSAKWGLVGDGVADDTTQNQRMVDFAAANDQDSVLYEAGGTFSVTTFTNTSFINLTGANAVFSGVNNKIFGFGQSGGGFPGDDINLSYEPTPDQMLSRRMLQRNGASLLDTDYPELLAAFGGKIYGNVDGTHFNLPDDRGLFERIWDDGAGVDPDSASRTDRGDGTTGDSVGTLQIGGIEAHSHTVPRSASGGLGDDVVRGGGSPTGVAVPGTSDTGGNETRPINTYKWGGIFY